MAVSPTIAPDDKDGDGMPDIWEESRGLDPNDPDDADDRPDNGYSEIEIYINELADRLVRPGASTAAADPRVWRHKAGRTLVSQR